MLTECVCQGHADSVCQGRADRVCVSGSCYVRGKWRVMRANWCHGSIMNECATCVRMHL